MATTDRKSDFADVFKRYYRTERERSEQCITDILNIICSDPDDASEREDRIIERLIKHYSR